MRPERSYIVCSTPRSGSTYLCELLKSTGVAGRPEEYFEGRPDSGLPPHPGEYLEGLPRTGAGVRDNHAPPDAPFYSDLRRQPSYRAHLRRTLTIGTTSNGVFGTKLMWRQTRDLSIHAAALPEYAGLELPELLERLLGTPVYVWVYREDKARQAISLWRALQTRIWRLEEHQGDAAPPPLRYSFEAIDHLRNVLQRDDEAWKEYFSVHGLAHLPISYEQQLERSPRQTVMRVLEHLGVPAPPRWAPIEATQRQADELNEKWLAAYHREAMAPASSR